MTPVVKGSIPGTIADAARAIAARTIAARTLSPVELTHDLLSRIDALDGALHAFTEVTRTRALADAIAIAAETRARTGTLRGPLDGIPIAHKDIFATAGTLTTGCSRLLDGWHPANDADAVARLTAAGTVMLGKLTCYERAFARPDPDLPWPLACNPWDRSRSPSGSSSGTAVAVAAGLVLGATGSDTGGSVRDPAAVCGVTGIKPTYGLCSTRGMLPFAPSLDHPGVMAWTALDCALLLDAIAGPARSPDRPAPDFAANIDGGVRGMKIGLVRRFHEDDAPASPATRRGVDHAVEVFRSLGAAVTEVSLPPLAGYQACGWVIALAELRATHEAALRFDGGARFGEPLREGPALGGLLSAADLVQATRQRAALCAATAAAMAGFDLLLLATQPSEASPMTEAEGDLPFEKANYTMVFNVTGQPAISVPSGFGEHGLPVAIQLAARPWHEALLLRAAHAYQSATRWREQRPPEPC